MRITDKAVEAFIETYKLECEHRYDPDAIRAALTAALPHMGGVKVKPLEWSDPWPDDKEGDTYTSAHLGLAYHVQRNDRWLVTVSYWGCGEPRKLGFFCGLEEAKAAAQADYERRIMSAIEVSASPRVVTVGREDESVVAKNATTASADKMEVKWTITERHGEREKVTRLVDKDAATRIITACQQEVERLRERSEKFKWQVRDTCRRAEAAEALNAELVKALEEIASDDERGDYEGVVQFARAALKGQSNERD